MQGGISLPLGRLSYNPGGGTLRISVDTLPRLSFIPSATGKH